MEIIVMKQLENSIWITMADIRRGGGCAWGLRAWFKHYGLSFNDFIQNGGIDSATFLSTGDALAIRIVELAKQASVLKG